MKLLESDCFFYSYWTSHIRQTDPKWFWCLLFCLSKCRRWCSRPLMTLRTLRAVFPPPVPGPLRQWTQYTLSWTSTAATWQERRLSEQGFTFIMFNCLILLNSQSTHRHRKSSVWWGVSLVCVFLQLDCCC